MLAKNACHVAQHFHSCLNSEMHISHTQYLFVLRYGPINTVFVCYFFFLLVSTLIRLSANLFNCSVFNFISINWILEICDLICFYIFLIFIFSTFSIVAGCPFYKLSNCFSFKLVGKQKYIYIGWCRSKNNKQKKIHE